MKRLDVLSKLDLAVILSVFTGLCYVFTYLYYIGIFFYHSIPIEFIDIDVKAVILTMLILSPTILVLIVNVVLNLRNEIQTKRMLNKKEKDKIITLQKEINNLGTKNKKQYKSIADIKVDILPIRDSIEKLLNRELSESDREVLEEEGYNIEGLEQDITEIEQDIRKNEKDQIQRNLTLNQISEMLFDLKMELVKRISILLILICILIVLTIYLFNANLYIAIYLILGQLGLLWLTALLYKRKQLILVATSIIIYLVAFACGSGINYGYLQEKHIVFEENENSYVVLTVYKEQFLYAQFDTKTNEVGDKYSLISIGDVKGFSKRRIGKIKVVDMRHLDL